MQVNELTFAEKSSCTTLAGGTWVRAKVGDVHQRLWHYFCCDNRGSYFFSRRSTAAAHCMVTSTAQSAAAIETAGSVAMTTGTACLPNLRQRTIISS